MYGHSLYENEKEQRHHRMAVESLAQHLNRSIEGVNSIYEIVLTRYKRTARIKDFLSPLVMKRVKELLKDDKPPSEIEGRRTHSSLL